MEGQESEPFLVSLFLIQLTEGQGGVLALLSDIPYLFAFRKYMFAHGRAGRFAVLDRTPMGPAGERGHGFFPLFSRVVSPPTL